MVGSATFAMAESITAMVIPSAMVRMAQVRCGSGMPSSIDKLLSPAFCQRHAVLACPFLADALSVMLSPIENWESWNGASLHCGGGPDSGRQKGGQTGGRGDRPFCGPKIARLCGRPGRGFLTC